MRYGRNIEEMFRLLEHGAKSWRYENKKGHKNAGLKMTGIQHRTIIGLVLAALCLVPSSFARFGETVDQLKERYGTGGVAKAGRTTEKHFADETRSFKKDLFWIKAYVTNGICVKIVYQTANGSPIKPEDVSMLLDANKEGSHWLKTDQPTNFEDGKVVPTESWRRIDKKAYAMRYRMSLVICSHEYAELAKAANAPKPKPEDKGF